MKRILSYVLVCVLLFSLAACDINSVTAPTNIKISDSGLISWDAVDGAIGYLVTVNDRQENTTNTYFQVSSVINDFTYSVGSIDANYKVVYSDTFTFEGKGSVLPEPAPEDVSVNISGMADIHSGGTLQLVASVANAQNASVVWSVVSGADVISIDSNGLITAAEVSTDTKVSVKATSVANPAVSQTRELNVITKPILTQAMIDALRGDKISFNGFVNIDAYEIGIFSKFYDSYSMLINTMSDGSRWYAEYINTVGTTSGVYCAEKDGKACTVDVNYLNEEVFTPMLNDDGSEVTWEESGYYNCFNRLSAADFTFDEESWSWVYTGADKQMPAKIVASANPYNFNVDGFQLSIYNGEIVGIVAKSLDDYGILSNYRCVQTLYATMIVYDDDSDDFEMPKVEVYSHEDIHDGLQIAIDNMQALSSYTVDLSVLEHSAQMGTTIQSGYVETVTDDICYFVPYSVSVQSNYTEVHTPDESTSYGYLKISDSLYNSFYSNGSGFVANRAFNGSFSDAKASFAFAPEIFRSHTNDEAAVNEYLQYYLGYYYQEDVSGAELYMADGLMAAVATTMYKSVGNDMSLYGIFATDKIYLYDYDVDATFVVVQNGYITDVVFWFDMYIMYGIVTMHFDNFNNATIPEGVSFDGYTNRTVPTSWEQISVESDDSTPVSQFLADMFGNDVEIPFFGTPLQDSFGFVMKASHIDSQNSSHASALFYYDVPLDDDYTIESSLQAVGEYLLGLGFTKNIYGEYNLGNLWVTAVDNDLDLIIYVWVSNGSAD